MNSLPATTTICAAAAAAFAFAVSFAVVVIDERTVALPTGCAVTVGRSCFPCLILPHLPSLFVVVVVTLCPYALIMNNEPSSSSSPSPSSSNPYWQVTDDDCFQFDRYPFPRHGTNFPRLPCYHRLRHSALPPPSPLPPPPPPPPPPQSQPLPTSSPSNFCRQWGHHIPSQPPLPPLHHTQLQTPLSTGAIATSSDDDLAASFVPFLNAAAAAAAAAASSSWYLPSPTEVSCIVTRRLRFQFGLLVVIVHQFSGTELDPPSCRDFTAAATATAVAKPVHSYRRMPEASTSPVSFPSAVMSTGQNSLPYDSGMMVNTGDHPKRRSGGRRPKEEQIQLSPEEEEKRRLRRLRNKEAAARCRRRRLEHMSKLQAVFFVLSFFLSLPYVSASRLRYAFAL
ncbi:unnamed protein product [Soboliphyme baturini]|uniref:BZIP domain-containing protein n=1 Tax=Soboliphyme baturini TaxID=241478 RepID=A0A183IR19_9BILA|nr:unnamed protein product [Soboliphyme baturini]